MSIMLSASYRGQNYGVLQNNCKTWQILLCQIHSLMWRAFLPITLIPYQYLGVSCKIDPKKCTDISIHSFIFKKLCFQNVSKSYELSSGNNHINCA